MTTDEEDRRLAFAGTVAGALIDAHVETPALDQITRRRRVADLLDIAVDVFEQRGDYATAETIREHAYALDPVYGGERARERSDRA